MPKTDEKANCINETAKVETFSNEVQINKYDAEGLRYEMEENNQLIQFIFNHNKEVIVEEKESIQTSYIRSSRLLASSANHAKTYYHYASDEMGSITHIVDDEKILNSYEYDAWGNILNKTETVENRFQFNGQQLDPITGQYYLRARFYNPVIARFTQEDTYRGDGLNLYAYCANNPVSYVDPTGHESDHPKEAAQKEDHTSSRQADFNPKTAQKKLDDIRSQLPNTKLRNSGNMALADVDIEGLPEEFIAHSRINSLTDKGGDVADFSIQKNESERIFTTYVNDGKPGREYSRYHDTEAKILEDIASQIKDPTVKGTINLYTELPACQSCTNIIFEFRRNLPNIELNIFTR